MVYQLLPGYYPSLTCFLRKVIKLTQKVLVAAPRAIVCKLTETVYQLVQFLADKDPISKRRHAFMKDHSMASNLLACMLFKPELYGNIGRLLKELTAYHTTSCRTL